MSERQTGWAKTIAGILLVVIPPFFGPGAIAIGAALLGVILIATGVRQLRSLSQPKVPMTPGRSRLFRIVGWLLVVPFVAALVFGIFVLASVDPNEQTESIERVMAAVFVILTIPLAWGGWVMIRRGHKKSMSSDTKPA